MLSINDARSGVAGWISTPGRYYWNIATCL